MRTTELVNHVFANQALNTLSAFGSRSVYALEDSIGFRIPLPSKCVPSIVESVDARAVNRSCDIWITDPPYADAVNYHELSEFFLAWYSPVLRQCFPKWHADSRRALAVTGSDISFRRSMVDCYKTFFGTCPTTVFKSSCSLTKTLEFGPTLR